MTEHEAFADVKVAMSSAPVLKYYDLNKEVTMQCDVSLSAFGATLMQEDQPVVYASCDLISVGIHYAQIEKLLLAIVFPCECFVIYVYSRIDVNVQSDHTDLWRS